jgi:hypothetical protein
MKLTKDMLLKMNACTPGFDWFNQQNETDVGKLIQLAIDNLSDKTFSYANWGIARLLARQDKIRYAVFAAELVLPVFEEKYPDDDRPRKAIATAKAVIEDDSEENRKRTADAARAAYAYVAAYAADAAAAAAAAAYAAARAAYAAYAADAAANAANAASHAKKKEFQKKILEYGKSLLIGNK